MILDRESLKNNFIGLVGMHQTDNPDYQNLATSLLTSRSNRYVQDVLGNVITIENIWASTKNFEEFNYATYDGSTESTEYELYDRVVSSSVVYEYINPTASTGNAPPNATYWQVVNELSDYLTRQYRQAIDEVLDAFINAKKLRENVKSIFDNTLLYDGIANRNDTIPNGDNFVGLKIRVKDGRSIVGILNKIGTQFDSSVTVPIKLFHSSRPTAIAEFNVTHSSANSALWTSWPSASKTLRYWGDNFVGGEYYIGYKQSDLGSAKALKMTDVVWGQSPNCSSCNKRWYRWFQNYSKVFDISAFQIPESVMPGTSGFDSDLMAEIYANNFGLNLNITGKCDLGAFLIQEEDIFSEAIQLGWAKKLLEGMAKNTRTGNNLANSVREIANKELYEFREAKGTVMDRFHTAIKGIEFDLSDLGDDCLPCDYKGDRFISSTNLR